ncbi:NAD-glutamate dehydrogenase domain-containing protein [Methylomonas sp. DH-1]|uniref:NAD-glutamate dehydrogenase domain-containing protein n=1 Tax=Methylomonas sp. (strain DH-1) TaxID=1727196 RepID=UPI0007C948D9|nr:NAD-glutamate dehydrogenase domain-containing protein [Methylomonas sp. DH-1]ANE56427.1 NAD-glutamate dehydrogenase [Methylomonas sp. DH-1]
MQNQDRSWNEELFGALQQALGGEHAAALWRNYAAAFPFDYQALIAPQHAVRDLLNLERLSGPAAQTAELLEPANAADAYRLHFYGTRQRYLDEFIPVLENLNLRVLDQVQFVLGLERQTVYLKSFSVKPAATDCAPLERVKPQLLATIQAVMAGGVENDGLNRLVTLTGMDWRDCDLLRTYRNYFLQLHNWASKATIHQALAANPAAAQGLFNYFEARFRPNPEWQDYAVRDEQMLFPLRMQLLQTMAAVANIQHDRILRGLFNLIDATVRSNFHLRREAADHFIAIKLNSLGVIDMPAPRPQYEIYVHAADMEGIHLRGGRVSRGGIRWSDRIDDFRTEILDLMQTQISKNALIIPTGAKGGFVVKPGAAGLDAKQAGQQAYRRLICGLLDLTDNLQDGIAASPPQLVVHDDPDPYLVVAADKGTAKFSDIANAVAAEYRFWLGDAFASGGSHGYDHKALGITARGAWECVKRHFREMGKDIQTEAFSVVGIGSMDGDVFGNGMLLSPCIRLQAAFSGLHIFIDPNPPADETAFNERKRLFELPGSSWQDYDRNLISAGGGVYSRSDKDIPVSPELKSWLGIRYRSIDGEALIQYLLKAPVELLWLGGIGTYVKAAAERHADVGDRGNDNVRVDAGELRALVVGEGANLGFTQAARIEYALRGGRINTDAVDNSAGVDTSDHEVNLKILLAGLHKQNLVDDCQTLFESLTEAVCADVLQDNIEQSLCLSLDQIRCQADPALFMQVAERLEAAGFLDRSVESFPEAKDVMARPGQALTRPELAVLMAAAKMFLVRQLQKRPEHLDAARYQPYLAAYFPAPLRERFGANLAEHPLAAEIKATVIANRIVNQAGSGFLALDDGENGGILGVVDAYLAFDQALAAEALRARLAAVGPELAAELRYQCLLQLEQALSGFCLWAAARQPAVAADADTVSLFRGLLAEYRRYQFADGEIPQAAKYVQAGMPAELAAEIGFVENLPNFLWLAGLVEESGRDFASVDRLLQSVDQTLAIRPLAQQLAQIPQRDYWVRSVCAALQADLRRCAGAWVKQMLAHGCSSCAEYVELKQLRPGLNRYRKIHAESRKLMSLNLLSYVVLVRALGAVLPAQVNSG